MQANAANLLLEEPEDEVGALIAGSIQNSVRTVLSTVGPKRVPHTVVRASNHTATAKSHPKVHQASPRREPEDNDGFEQVGFH